MKICSVSGAWSKCSNRIKTHDAVSPFYTASKSIREVLSTSDVAANTDGSLYVHGSNLSQRQFPTDVWCVQRDSLQCSPQFSSRVSALH